MQEDLLVSVERISVRLRDKVFLSDISWKIGRGHQWAILGPNGSGKTTLAKALFGQVPVIHGDVKYFFTDAEGEPISETENLSRIAYVSPDDYRSLIQRTMLEDSFRDFSGRVCDFTAAKTVLFEGLNKQGANRNDDRRVLEVAGRMGIEHLLESPVEALSIGESRKLLIARALIRSPKLLILDKPFDGLDRESRRSLGNIVKELIEDGISILLITNRTEEIMEPITHVLLMQDGKLSASGRKEDILGNGNLTDSLAADPGQFEIDDDLYRGLQDVNREILSETRGESSLSSETLVEMKNVTVRYNGLVVLNHIDWNVRRGENWAILGPNGAGKSTLFKLILGDNQQAYANKIMLFGQDKGSGASIWEIKKNIGVVSADLQARYKAETKVVDVVCSGFHDSVGLYSHCSDLERKAADLWLKVAGLEDLANERFDRLSYGQRQLVLVARAVVKGPLLLLLDEPFDGLDSRNRIKLSKIIDFIESNKWTNIILTSHHEDEIPECIQNALILSKGKVVGSLSRPEGVSWTAALSREDQP